MALKVLQAGIYPLGQFDGYDNQISVSGIKGGEVATLTGYLISGSDKAAWDMSGYDGYVGVSNKLRPVVTKNLVSGNRPLFLTDDGTSGYGTLFGQLVGGVAGKVVAGSQLGPHTSEGSGKVTLWDKAGLYATTLDAVDTNASTGLMPTNTSLTVGSALYATSAGLLTPTSGSAFEALVVGRFVEFSTNGSLVTTPNFLVSGGAVAFTQAVYHFEVET